MYFLGRAPSSAQHDNTLKRLTRSSSWSMLQCFWLSHPILSRSLTTPLLNYASLSTLSMIRYIHQINFEVNSERERITINPVLSICTGHLAPSHGHFKWRNRHYQLDANYEAIRHIVNLKSYPQYSVHCRTIEWTSQTINACSNSITLWVKTLNSNIAQQSHRFVYDLCLVFPRSFTPTQVFHWSSSPKTQSCNFLG